MKIPALAILALAMLARSASAQDFGTTVETRSWSSSSSGYGWGAGSFGTSTSSGFFSGYGGGWIGGYRPGLIAGYPGFGTAWSGTGGYYGAGYYGGYPGYGWGEGHYGRPTPPAAGVAGPNAPSIDRTPSGTASREIEEGRRRFRTGDYRSALDAFRSAVVATPDNPVAQAWFAVALIAAGEGKNADKAIRAAAAGGLAPGALSLDGLFRDEKERVRVIVALAKVGTEGGLAAAYALSLAGEPVRLKQLSEKDAAARRLLPKP
jgi:hypothetical protein